jgi:hypothetical protein
VAIELPAAIEMPDITFLFLGHHMCLEINCHDI